MDIDPDAHYYRAVKDNFLWKEGAILTNSEDEEQYTPIDGLDIWNMLEYNEGTYEYASDQVVEHSPEWFERVYPFKKSEEDENPMFATAEEAKDKFKFEFQPINPK